MKNAAALHTSSWVSQTKKEANEQFKKWDSAKKKKWQTDYMAHCSQTAAMILENAQETLSKANALKDSMKAGLDGMEKIIQAQRNKSVPLTDGERAWIQKTKKTIEESPAQFAAFTKAYSDNSPFAYRDGFMEDPLKDGALTADMVSKIKAERLVGINTGNEFGKQSPVVARLAEYRQRWTILENELQTLEQTRGGNPQQAAAELTKQIKELQAGNVKWETDFANDIGKLVSNIEGHFEGGGKVEKGKGFGASLVKSVKLLVSAKAKAKDKKAISDKQITIKAKLDKWTTDLKGVKGALKTRLMAEESLSASLSQFGPAADPFRKMLADIKAGLNMRQTEVDALILQVNEAINELKK